MIFTISAVVILFIITCIFLNKKKPLSLQQKHVVVTGGSSGIGKEVAIETARRGAHVTIIGRSISKLESAVNEIKTHAQEDQKIQYLVLDISEDYTTISERLSKLEKEVASIFMLVNCAGQCICGVFEDMKPEEIDYLFKLNYFGSAYCTKYVLPGMKARNEGIIVLVSTAAALIGIYGYSAYGSAKWAVRGLGESLLMELVGTNVNLTISFPPDTDTPGFQEEEKTKPEETKLISGSAGLFSAAEVAKQMVEDALIGKTYSVVGMDSQLLTLLYCGSIESVKQVITQVFAMGILRLVMVGYTLSFHRIIKNKLQQKLKSQ